MITVASRQETELFEISQVPLGAGASATSNFLKCLGYGAVRILARSDVSGTVRVFQAISSPASGPALILLKEQASVTDSVSGDEVVSFSVDVTGEFMRIVYVNGAVPQTAFEIGAALLPVSGGAGGGAGGPSSPSIVGGVLVAGDGVAVDVAPVVTPVNSGGRRWSSLMSRDNTFGGNRWVHTVGGWNIADFAPDESSPGAGGVDGSSAFGYVVHEATTGLASVAVIRTVGPATMMGALHSKPLWTARTQQHNAADRRQWFNVLTDATVAIMDSADPAANLIGFRGVVGTDVNYKLAYKRAGGVLQLVDTGIALAPTHPLIALCRTDGVNFYWSLTAFGGATISGTITIDATFPLVTTFMNIHYVSLLSDLVGTFKWNQWANSYYEQD